MMLKNTLISAILVASVSAVVLAFPEPRSERIEPVTEIPQLSQPVTTQPEPVVETPKSVKPVAKPKTNSNPTYNIPSIQLAPMPELVVREQQYKEPERPKTCKEYFVTNQNWGVKTETRCY